MGQTYIIGKYVYDRILLLMEKVLNRVKEYSFLFEQLVSRDFKRKYKRTVLGMLWSVLSPLLMLFVMRMIFINFFGSSTPHYTIYLFAGIIVMSFYREATKTGMTSLVQNTAIVTKINVPKYLFIFSRNVSAFVNFALTLGVFFVYCLVDRISFSPSFLMLIFPSITLTLMNIGIGMILSCLYIFFRDMTYLYDVFLTLLNYLSAVFYTIDRFAIGIQQLFLLNPVYAHIRYFRMIVIENAIPGIGYHGLLLLYALIFLAIGFYMYKRYNYQFIYYL